MTLAEIHQRIAELRIGLATNIAGRERIDALNELARLECDFDAHETERLCDEAYTLATTGEFADHPYTLGIVAILCMRGQLHVWKGWNAQCLEESFAALELVQGTPNTSLEIAVRVNIVWTLMRMGELEKATEHALVALELAQITNDLYQQANALDALGGVYAGIGDFPEGLENALQSLELFQSLGEYLPVAFLHNNVAWFYLQVGNHQAALEHARICLQATREANFQTLDVLALGTAGEIYLAQQDYARAVEMFTQYRAQAEKKEMHAETMNALFFLGKTYHLTGQTELALTVLRRALALAAEYQLTIGVSECYELLARILEEQNDFQNALIHLKMFLALREELTLRSAQRVHKLTVSNRLKSTQRALEELHRQTQTLQAELDEQKRARESLHAIAARDPLTGIWNRRHFTELAEQYLQTTGADNWVSLVLFDIDHFKSVNDTYGHPVGDEALKQVSTRVEEGLRTTDLFGRLGGDEFILLLPDTRDAQAKIIAERLRYAVESRKWWHDNQCILLTLSVGVAAGPVGQVKTLTALVHSADQALYQAKRGGRNQTVVSRCAPQAQTHLDENE